MAARNDEDDGSSEAGAGEKLASELQHQPETCPRHPAGIVTGLACAADFGADSVDAACGRYADLARQRGASVAVAVHPPKRRVDQRAGNEAEFGLILSREAWPLARERAASAAALARHVIGRQQLHTSRDMGSCSETAVRSRAGVFPNAPRLPAVSLRAAAAAAASLT